MSIPLERYWAAVMDNPRRPGEGPMTYIVRIAELVEGGALESPGREMPDVPRDSWLPYREAE